MYEINLTWTNGDPEKITCECFKFCDGFLLVYDDSPLTDVPSAFYSLAEIQMGDVKEVEG